MVREMFVGSHGMFWPKGDVAEHREVEWKREKDETIGKRSKTKENPKGSLSCLYDSIFHPLAPTVPIVVLLGLL